MLVAVVDEVHKIVGRAVTAGGRKVAYRLVAPRAVEGVLGDGHQLDVGIAHLCDVLDELVRQVAIAEKAPAFLMRHASPTAQVDFVDADWLVEGLALLALLQPLLIVPLVAVDVPHPGIGAGADFGIEAVGVRLVRLIAEEARLHRVLVVGSLRQVGNEKLPYARPFVKAHQMDARVPAVKFADDADALRVGPKAQVDAAHAVDCHEMRAQLLVAIEQVALAKQIEVVVGQERRKAVGVLQLVFRARRVGRDEAIGERFGAVLEHGLEEAGGVHALHGRALAGGRVVHKDSGVQRAEGADRDRRAVIHRDHMRAENIERRTVITVDNGGNIAVGNCGGRRFGGRGARFPGCHCLYPR